MKRFKAGQFRYVITGKSNIKTKNLPALIITIIALLITPLQSYVLDSVPLIDGHNNLPSTLFLVEKNDLRHYDFTKNLNNFYEGKCYKGNFKTCQTDLSRLREGKVGTVFWVAFTSCKSQYADSVARTLEQIDVIKRLVQKYHEELQLVTESNGIMDAFSKRKIGSLIGVKGGHSIDSRAGVLRMYYDIGVRYMSLTYAHCSTPWADNFAADEPIINLSEFGKKIVLEMNRLGMLVDLSDSSHVVRNTAINISRAPVMFSHSGAFTAYESESFVHNDTLKLLKKNRGIIMVSFESPEITREVRTPNIYDIIRQINTIADVVGIDSIGIGSNFDGFTKTPKGLEDVSKFPDLFNRLKHSDPERWTTENLTKLASDNFIRVFKEVEAVRDSLKGEIPFQDWIHDRDLNRLKDRKRIWKCRSTMSGDNSGSLRTHLALELLIYIKINVIFKILSVF